MNEDIRTMITRPGRYAVSDAGFMLLHRQYVAVEVTEDGTVHQLTRQGERDGVLSADGWGQQVRVFTMSADEKTFARIGATND